MPSLPKQWQEAQLTAVPMPIFECEDCGTQVCQVRRPEIPQGVCYLCFTLRNDTVQTDEEKRQTRQKFHDMKKLKIG